MLFWPLCLSLNILHFKKKKSWISTQGQNPEIFGLFRHTEVLLGLSSPAASARNQLRKPSQLLFAGESTHVCATSHIPDLLGETQQPPALPQHKLDAGILTIPSDRQQPRVLSVANQAAALTGLGNP